MTNSNILRLCRNHNISYTFTEVIEKSFAGVMVPKKKAVITKELVTKLINTIKSKGRYGIDGRDVSRWRNASIKNLTKHMKGL